MAALEPRQCSACNRLLLASDFYASGSKCRQCTRAAVRENRHKNAEYYRSYDRMRYREDPTRRAHCIAMGKTIPMPVRVAKQRDKRLKEPEKYLARQRVGRALRRGEIAKAESCYFCASDGPLQAHHQDYRRPLDVFWLCSSCHGKFHAVTGDFHRTPTEIPKGRGAAGREDDIIAYQIMDD